MRQLLLLVVLGLVACASERPEGEALLRQARKAHGADRLEHATVEFALDGARFRVERDGERFAYARTWADRSGLVFRDVLTAEGLERTIDGRAVGLGEAARREAATALRAAVYLALLPFSLDGAAEEALVLTPDTLSGQAYERVALPLDRAAPGLDERGRLVLWIHPERHTVDYLAYRYAADGGGARFRAAYEPRTVEGVRFANHYEFSGDLLEVPVEGLGQFYERGELNFLGRVELDSVRVLR